MKGALAKYAYYQAIGEFLAWSQRCGFQSLENIDPITFAAYIEQTADPLDPRGK